MLAFLLNKKVQLIGVAILCLLSFTGGYRLKAVIEQAKQADVLQDIMEAHAKQIEQGNKNAENVEKELSRIRSHNRALNKLLDVELQNPVYKSCVVPPDGLRLLNEAIATSTAPSNFND